jgi:predicted aspartyl protease
VGYIRVKAKIWNVEAGGIVKEVGLLADTGAIYSALPRSILEELGVKPMGRRKFRLANNQVLERDVGIVGIEVEGLKTHTIAVFGDEGVFLLGVVTLEELGLQVDPVRGELKPLELLLMGS